MINEIKSISVRQSFIGLFVFIGSVSPGSLIIFYFDPELFKSLDTIKLMILSLAITLPVVFLNLFITSVYIRALNIKEKLEQGSGSDSVEKTREEPCEDKKELDLLVQLMAAFWMAAVILYLSLLSVFVMKGSIEEFFYSLLAGQAVIFAFTYIIHLSNLMNLKKLDKQSSELSNASERVGSNS